MKCTALCWSEYPIDMLRSGNMKDGMFYASFIKLNDDDIKTITIPDTVSQDDINWVSLRQAAEAAITKTWGNDKDQWPSRIRDIDFEKDECQKGWPFIKNNPKTKTDKTSAFFDRIRIAACGFSQSFSVKRGSDKITEDLLHRKTLCCATFKAYTYDFSGYQGVKFGIVKVEVIV